MSKRRAPPHPHGHSILRSAGFLGVAVFVVLSAIHLALVRYRFDARLDSELDKDLNAFVTAYNGAINHFNEQADFILDEILANPEVTRALFEFRTASDDSQRAAIRNRLQGAMQAFYLRLQKHGIKQLHFHSAESTSILRMHRPDRWGDSLLGVRHTVEEANSRLLPVAAFEEGRVFNGMRFVYPLFHDGVHVGSVECSFSTEAIRWYADRIDASRRSIFLIRKDAVLSKVFLEYQTNYTEWIFDSELMLESNAWVTQRTILPSLEPSQLAALHDPIRKAWASLRDSEVPATANFAALNSHWILFVQPVYNILGERVAAYVGMSESPTLATLSHQQLLTNSTGLLVIALISAFLASGFQVWRNARYSSQLYDLQLQRIAEHVPGMICEFRFWPDSRKIALPFVSPAIESIFQTTAGAVREDATPALERIHADDRPNVIDGIRQSAESMNPWRAEFRVVLHNGTIEWREAFGTPRAEPDGSITWHGFVTDITERRHIEAALQEQREITRFILEEAIGGYWDWNLSDNSEYLSPRFKAMFGYADDELENSPEAWMRLIHPDDLRIIMQNFERHVASAGQIPFYTEARYAHKDGSTVWMICVGKVIEWDAEHQPVRMVGCHIDITDRKQAEAALVQRNAELDAARRSAEDANRAKSAFLATMSHEIRTPLNAIIGMASILSEANLPEQERGFADTIAQSGDALLALINDVLDYSKIEAERLELAQEPFALLELCETPLNIIAKAAADKHLELNFHINPQAPARLLGDAGRLRQVLLNLLSNAVKFTECGAISLRVDAQSDADARTCALAVSVEDSGIGIEPENIERLFQPFTQVDSSTTRRFGGTGLGLTISQRIVQQMGGTIAVHSEVGVGSRFAFTLNLPIDDAHPIFAARTEPLSGEPAVLLLHSAAGQNGLTRAFLDALNAQTHAFTDPTAAADFLTTAQRPPFAAIIDATLFKTPPQPDELRAILLSRQVPLIAVFPDLHGAKRLPHVANLTPHHLTHPLTFDAVAALLHSLQGKQSPQGKEANATPPAPPPASKNLHILIADDNLVNRRVLEVALAQMGHRTSSCTNGREAVDATRADNFDLILMDVEMPVLDGISATREIIAFFEAEGTPRPLIFALTANALPEHRHACIDAGMDDYLAKPVKPAQLAARINAAFKA